MALHGPLRPTRRPWVLRGLLGGLLGSLQEAFQGLLRLTHPGPLRRTSGLALHLTGLFLSWFEGVPGIPWKSQKEGQEETFKQLGAVRRALSPSFPWYAWPSFWLFPKSLRLALEKPCTLPLGQDAKSAALAAASHSSQRQTLQHLLQ